MQPLNIFDRIARSLGTGTSYLFMLVVGLVFFEVVGRYLLNSPTFWVHEASIALCAVAFIFAGGYVYQARDHITITVLYEKIPLRIRGKVDLINALITVYYLAALFYGAQVQAGKSLAVMENTGTASRLPTPVVMKTLLAVGALLMIFQALATLVAQIRRLTER